MTTPTTPESPDIHAWEAFAERHAGNPFLGLDPLYALSEPIIDAIGRESPGFFDAGQERFERDLARTAHFGFFLRRAYGPGSDGTAGGAAQSACRTMRGPPPVGRGKQHPPSFWIGPRPPPT